MISNPFGLGVRFYQCPLTPPPPSAVPYRSRWRESAGRRVRERAPSTGHGAPKDRRAGAQRCQAVRHIAPTQSFTRLRLQDTITVSAAVDRCYACHISSRTCISL